MTTKNPKVKKEKKVVPLPVDEKPVEAKPLTQSETKEVQVIVEKFIQGPADDKSKMSRPQIDLLKRTIANGASDDELMLFINICRSAQLNPFLHHAHFVPFWDSKAGAEKRAVIIGIDGFRSIAESSGKYAGSDDVVFEGEDQIKVDVWEGKGKDRKVVRQDLMTVPKKATVTVWKIVDGQRYAFTATARWGEYFPGSKKGARWLIMPYLMLGKCAEALALRKAFPKLLSGLYAPEEMDQAQRGDGGKREDTVGTKKLIAAGKNADLPTLKAYLKKLEGSEKYSDEVKAEVKAALEPRLVELSQTPKKEGDTIKA